MISTIELGGDGGRRPTAQIIDNIMIYTVFWRWEVMGVPPTTQIIENIVISIVF